MSDCWIETRTIYYEKNDKNKKKNSKKEFVMSKEAILNTQLRLSHFFKPSK